MPIAISCPHCDWKGSVKDELAGKKGKCPTCGELIPIPASSSPPPMPGAKRVVANDTENSSRPPSTNPKSSAGETRPAADAETRMTSTTGPDDVAATRTMRMRTTGRRDHAGGRSMTTRTIDHQGTAAAQPMMRMTSGRRAVAAESRTTRTTTTAPVPDGADLMTTTTIDRDGAVGARRSSAKIVAAARARPGLLSVESFASASVSCYWA